MRKRRNYPVRGLPIEVALRRPRDVAEREFWDHVDRNGPTPMHCPGLGPCWIWAKGTKMPYGYGVFYRLGAHRVSYWLATGTEPGDLHVRHRCDNPPCVRPEHLQLGTHAENMADMAERRRAGKPGTKLTDEQVEQIRSRYASGERARALATEFGISQQQTNRILNGQTRYLASVPTEWRERGLRGQSQKLTDEQREEIRRRHAAGESNADLSRAFQVSNGYVTEVVHGRKTRNRKSAVPRQIRTVTPEEIREIRQRWQQGGVSQKALAQEYGLAPSTVSRMVTGMSHREVG